MRQTVIGITTVFFILLFVVLITAFNREPHYRDLASFTTPDAACYNRQIEPYTAVVDSHVHFRGFGQSLSFTEMIEYFNKTGILFANVNGIGQVLPSDSLCTYYLDCPGYTGNT